MEQPAEEELIHSGIRIKNAGLVLANSYFKILFERLEFQKDGQFKPSDQNKAVFYLQYLATESSEGNPNALGLNKVLSGLNLEAPLDTSVEIPQEHQKLMNELIKAMIGHWEYIDGSSIEGFRGSWFVRDGMLYEYEDNFHLIIEKQSYDLLLRQCPFPFSMVHLPWMKKPLRVDWI